MLGTLSAYSREHATLAARALHIGASSTGGSNPPQRLRRRLLVAVAGSTLGLLGFAPVASAGTELVIPPGSQAKITNVKFSSCNSLTYGYQIDGGAKTELASTPGQCGGEVSAPDATIGPFEVEKKLTLYLTDNSCEFTFYSNGSEHTAVSGSDPYLVQLWDGGFGCEYEPGAEDPDGPPGNLEATVTIAPVPGPPEYGQCVTQKKGEYTDSGCTTKSAKAKKGKFEWRPGPPASCEKVKKGFYKDAQCTERSESKGKPRGKFEAAPGPGFTIAAAGVAFGEVHGYPPLTCNHLAGAGEITGVKTGSVHLTLTECSAGGHPCTSSGQPAGTIRSAELATYLLEPKAGEVLTQFVSKAGLAEESYVFECEGLAFVAVFGEIGGVTGGDINVTSKSSSIDWGPGMGQQGYVTYINGGGPYATTAEVAATATFASNVEIRAK